MSSSIYPPIEDLVPHAPPMRMLDTLDAWESGYARCSMLVRETTPFVKNGELSTLLTIEHMAQAVAACLGYEAYQQGSSVRVGMILASRSFDMDRGALFVGETLTIEVRRQRGNEDLSHFLGEVHVAGERVSSAHMTIYHAERPPE